MTEFLKNLWIKIFGTTEWLGLNMGFWVSMAAVVILVVVMIAVFWSIKPKNNVDEEIDKTVPQQVDSPEK